MPSGIDPVSPDCLNRTVYPSLRFFLEEHKDGQWVMLGGDWAGKVRTSAGLLAESQKVALILPSGRAVTEDSLDYPVVYDGNRVCFPTGTVILGLRLPFDMPVMEREHIV